MCKYYFNVIIIERKFYIYIYIMGIYLWKMNCKIDKNFHYYVKFAFFITRKGIAICRIIFWDKNEIVNSNREKLKPVSLLFEINLRYLNFWVI